jgi:hypothetical protein
LVAAGRFLQTPAGEGTRIREYSCVENNIDPQRYEKLLADPSKFTRTPPAQ